MGIVYNVMDVMAGIIMGRFDDRDKELANKYAKIKMTPYVMFTLGGLTMLVALFTFDYLGRLFFG